ncbi:MAG: cyclic pyranopterin phosphate synthase MoaA [Chloroflexi bacterium RBG_16_51_9]|nr:MAG: cyclic pyranopterin phosphate synthase MoaA [Chloroflexi bacterium RBG_16_51_9]
MTGLIDSWQRQINYLRISVTDLCNLNCVYCSAGSIARLAHEDILHYEEIQRIVRIAAGMGITKVRLTGGEPLARPDFVKLVAMIAQIGGIDDIAVTTNGILLGKYARKLKEAGLNRVNISLDTLKRERFKEITGGDKLATVLAGIKTAHQAGLEPVKINVVVMRGKNEDEILDFGRKTIDDGWHVRFIEFMPFGTCGSDSVETVPTSEIYERLQVLGKLEAITGPAGNGPAKYFQFTGARGSVGFITPMTEHFCSTCNRLRITSDGHLRPCLLGNDEVALKDALRSGAGDAEIKRLIQQAVAIKREEHHLSGELAPEAISRPMYQIGG